MELKGKNILVTGADGFIGSHLVEALVEHGAQVRALSLYNSFNSWGWLEDVACLKDIEVITGDIRDPNFCHEIVKQADVIFHLAALIAIPYSYIAPDSYVDTNIKGTLNICQAASKNNKVRLIHTSTSEVYGTARYVPIDEKHPLEPQSPYSASKIGADAIALSFYHAFNLPVTIARPFNTYGPRQSARAVIPTIISQMVQKKNKIKLGDLRPTRDFNFVKDICSGFIAIAESTSTIGEVINLGTNREVSIKALFDLIKKIMDSKAGCIFDKQRKRPENSEVFRLCCDNTKANALINYTPKFSLEEGLRLTISWFSNPNNLKKYKAEIYNV
jgi:NAD dependent epimerase/dehydratase